MQSLLIKPTPIILTLLLLSFQAPAAPVAIDTSSINADASAQSTLRRIGGTVSSTSRPYEGIGNQIAFLPYLELEHGRFSVSGLNPGYKLRNPPQWDCSTRSNVKHPCEYKHNGSERITPDQLIADNTWVISRVLVQKGMRHYATPGRTDWL